MIMRNAAELLPSEYVCIGNEATLTAVDRDRIYFLSTQFVFRPFLAATHVSD